MLASALMVASCSTQSNASQASPPTPAVSGAPVVTASPPAVAASRPLGGINVEPSMRPWRYAGPNPDGWWCRMPDCTQGRDVMAAIDGELSLAAELGVANVRVEFPWPLIEPSPGSFDWARADAIVATANAKHVELQPVLVYTPGWAASSFTAPPPADRFAAFVQAVVTRYHASIRYWEMWNEPDIEHYWTGDEDTYVSNVLVPGYRAVKAADPTALVVLGAPASADLNWLNGIYTLGGGDSFDVEAFHDYDSAAEVLAAAALVHDVLRNHGQSGKPIWLGEYGVQESSTDDSAQQSLMTAVLTQSSPIALAQWYNLRDDYSMTCCPAQISVKGFWGLLLHDAVTKKSGYDVMRSLPKR